MSRFSLIIFSSLILSSPLVRAAVMELPPSLATQVLSESVPFVFSPADFSAADYHLVWASDPIPGVSLSIGSKSFEWVRVSKLFVIPRGVLVVQAPSTDSGTLLHNGFTQLFRQGHGEIPIALISGEKNTIELNIKRGDRDYHGKVLIRFTPRHQNERSVFIDTSCSPYELDIDRRTLPRESWMYVGCRLIYESGPEHPVAILELYTFWDGVGQEIKVGSTPVAASAVSVWSFHLRHNPGFVELTAKEGFAKINYHVADRLRFAHLGFGIGPYSYHYEGGTQHANGVLPLATLYGSYFINESMRFVMFEASPLHSTVWSDTGFYFNFEQVRTIDERFSVNLLLGAHFLLYQYGDSLYGRFSAPQGVELVFRDFLRRNHSIGIGAFIYPPINDTSYYNLWVRWGTPSLFVEFNYINWRQKIYDNAAISRAIGISVGMPLKRFL